MSTTTNGNSSLLLEQPVLSCPFASAMSPISFPVSCPHHHGVHPLPAPSQINDEVQNERVGGKYKDSEDTARLLADIGIFICYI